MPPTAVEELLVFVGSCAKGVEVIVTCDNARATLFESELLAA